MLSPHQQLGAAALTIELELKRLGLWAAEAVDDAPGAWLQFVLLPRVQRMVQTEAELTAELAVSAPVLEALERNPDWADLLDAVRAFDALLPPPEAPMVRLTRRLRERLSTLPAIRAAYLTQLYFPETQQLTTALVGLVVDGELPPDAFAQFPQSEPFVAMRVADDAVSRLMKLGPPFYERDASR